MMKKLLGLVVLTLIFSSCGEDAPEAPPAVKDLLVGNWQSQTATFKTTINGASTQTDSVVSGLSLQFTNTFWVYGDFDGIKDTSRYNCDGDSLYFIKNALAWDTLVIKHIDQSSLLLVTDFEQGSVNGNTFLTETIVNFFRN